MRSGSEKLLAECGVQLAERRRHGAHRLQRAPAAFAGVAVDAEQRHHPVADEFVHMAARLLDRAAHGEEIAVQQKDHVIGQLVLGQPGEGAQIREQDGNLAFGALLAARPRPRFRRPGCCRQQGHECHVARGNRLAGEAHPLRRADAPEQRLLAVGRRRQRVEAPRHMHPAGGAASPPAANRGMGDAGGAAHLQQRRAGFGSHHAPVGIGDADRPLPPRPERTDQPPRHQRGYRHAGHGAYARLDALHPLDTRAAGEADFFEHGTRPSRSRPPPSASTSRPPTAKPASASAGKQQRGCEE